MKYRNVKLESKLKFCQSAAVTGCWWKNQRKKAEAEKVGKRIQLKKLMNLANLPNLQIVPKM